MVIIQAEPRTVGRPSAKSNTVRILPSGVLRLSPDLCIAETFQVAYDKEKQQLEIFPDGPFKLWYSSPHARSGLLTVPTVFEQLNVLPKDVAGEYMVQPLKSKGFAVILMHPDWGSTLKEK